ncbi:MAG TPA: hypothetical protein VFN79_04325 [Steroidobacteraceae bacterium]|nr:hypothetical protein [Steroidobacteraceae bacterium]
MSSSYRKLYVALGAGALLGVGSGACGAANWEFLPRLEGGATYNDNYRMAEIPSERQMVYGPYIDAQLAADLISPRGHLDIVPRVVSNYYPNDTADNATNEYLDIDGDYTGLRSELKGVAQYYNATTIFSELPPATFPGVNLGQVVGGATGRVTFRNREQFARIAPEYLYDLTQRTHLDLQADVQHASFGKSLIQQYGYDNYTGRGGLLFDLTPRSKLAVRGVYSRFTPQVGSNTNRYGVEFQWSRRNSQIMQTYVRFGANRLAAQTAQGTINSNGFTGGAGVQWNFQVTQVVIDALRELTPSDAGSVITNDELRFRVLHAFEPRFSGFFGARALRVRGASNKPGLAIQGEDYVTGEMGVEYQVSLNFRVQGTYTLTWQQFQGEPSAESNAVGLAFIYQPLSQYQPLPEFTGIPREP